MSGRRRRWKSNQNYFRSLCFCRFWNHSSGFRAMRSNNKSMTAQFKKEIIFNSMSHEREREIKPNRRFRFAIPLSISTWEFSLGFVFAVAWTIAKTRMRWRENRLCVGQKCNHLLSILFAWLILIHLFSESISSFLQFNASNKYLYRLAQCISPNDFPGSTLFLLSIKTLGWAPKICLK